MLEAALTLKDVGKTYRLYGNVADQALDVFGLGWARFWRKSSYRDFAALSDVSLEVRRGERVGVLGRNGAGKTTLLKLITGNFAPTCGKVTVNGTVQALMNVGLGFHPEFSGYENMRASLAYSGLGQDDQARALEEIIEFVELDDFLHQPMKTYSLGMQARVMFAAATAIKPDILIVDEVLGAGDAYFSTKSSERMKKLAASGCTLLLVSHGMQQILEFCERAIWLDAGRIVKDGDALSVVKSYEAYVDRLKDQPGTAERPSTIVDKQWYRDKVLTEILQVDVGEQGAANVTSGGRSRWAGEGGLRIRDVRIFDEAGTPAAELRVASEMRIEIEMEAEAAGAYPCVIAVLLFTRDGRPLSRHVSEQETHEMAAGGTVRRILRYPRVMLGNGDYIVSAAVFRSYDPKNPGDAKRYDLLSRSFGFKVIGDNPLDPSVFHHPAEWVSAITGRE